MHTKTSHFFRDKSFISVDGMTPNMIKEICKRADDIRKMPFKQTSKILNGKVVTLLFFEPSSRTFSSFATAVKKLGGMTIEYQNPLQTSSSVKGESLEDTIRVFENYSDAVVMRHFEKGALKRAAHAVSIPVINAGDGIGEHPTQALLDIYTIFRKKKKLDGLTGVIVGDLLNGRTVHSLLKLLALYKQNKIYLLAPPALALDSALKNEVEKKGLTIIEISKQGEIPLTSDFWYWTRVQKERFTDAKKYEALKHTFVLTKKILDEKGNKNLILMHPLPRVGEIEEIVDHDPRALYLTEQIKNGLYMRMALLSLILGKNI
jgi:aspartate carbamoyltransferase